MQPRRQIIPHVTWTEYQQLPDDGRRYEVLEGELVVTPSPEFDHQIASLNIGFLVEAWRRATGSPGRLLMAPFDIVLAFDTIVQPDLLYLKPSTLALLVRGKLHGAPDLAVEIYNTRGAARDRVTKLQLYAKFGVLEYWLVDLEARCVMMLGLVDGTYEVFAQGTGDAQLVSQVLPGFILKPRDVFEGC